ncbi:AAA family ATPase [Sunxiuqinia indica]|uniref:AAA family ATPase n=1 Tax=Sunxiuqinia indica TaxID=2692584 RepID=UPI001356EC46|nr:AAA family ATPase [Sunxiuqinia indica]
MTRKITINQLVLRNFKKAKNFTLAPSPAITNISGDNRTGKTTLAAAFTWLLWGKDLQDRKDYEIKTLDENNNPIHKLEHEVSCLLDVDGIEISLKRIYKEKWTKKRGEKNEELTGHVTDLWWNDVPMKLADFTAKVKEVFGEESGFKTLTNPLFFNSLHWEERRGILIDIVGEISNTDLLAQNSKFQDLIDKLTGKSLKEYEAQIKEQKRKIKQELELIPVRLDEIDRNTPEEPDYAAIEQKIKDTESRISELDSLINSKTGSLTHFNTVFANWQQSISDLKTQLWEIEKKATEHNQKGENERNESVYALKKQIRELNQAIETDQSTLKHEDSKAEQIIIKQDQLRIQYGEESKKELVLDENEFSCPTCKREYEPGDIQKQVSEMQANFNTNKANKLEQINKQGLAYKNELETIRQTKDRLLKKISEYQEQVKPIEAQLKELENTPTGVKDVQSILSENSLYTELKARKESIENDPPQKPEDGQTTELQAEKKTLVASLDQFKSQLDIRDQIKKAQERKAELEKQETKLANELSQWERDEYLSEQFTRAKVNALESRVNDLFPSVKFKMFEDQINGGLKETCLTLIDGVPFPAANNAAQIQSGIEIINVLNQHYGITLPIFVDNSESVTTLPNTGAQLIKLIVSEKHKVLTVE